MDLQEPPSQGSTPRVRYRTGANCGVVRPMPTTVTAKEPTAPEALRQAWDDINDAREAYMRADQHRQAQCARSAIDRAATILVDPNATRREVVAAHSFLREALALNGQPNTCGAESIDVLHEASTLSPDDQAWLQNYLPADLARVNASSGNRTVTPLRDERLAAAVRATGAQIDRVCKLLAAALHPCRQRRGGVQP